jgi:hypothetical protein
MQTPVRMQRPPETFGASADGFQPVFGAGLLIADG